MVIYRNFMVSFGHFSWYHDCFCGLSAHQELGTWQEYMTIARRSGTQGEDAIYRMAPWRHGLNPGGQ
jgi:hypothetical protein